MCNRNMAKVVLDGSRINALVGQVVTAGVSEHMWMNGESEFGCLPCPGDELVHRAESSRSTKEWGRSQP